MKKKDKRKKIVDKIVMGAVIGGAVGSVVGASIKKKQKEKALKEGYISDKPKKKSLIVRLLKSLLPRRKKVKMNKDLKKIPLEK